MNLGVVGASWAKTAPCESNVWVCGVEKRRIDTAKRLSAQDFRARAILAGSPTAQALPRIHTTSVDLVPLESDGTKTTAARTVDHPTSTTHVRIPGARLEDRPERQKAAQDGRSRCTERVQPRGDHIISAARPGRSALATHGCVRHGRGLSLTLGRAASCSGQMARKAQPPCSMTRARPLLPSGSIERGRGME